MADTKGPWSHAEECFLIEHHGKLSNHEIGRRLGRSGASVVNRTQVLRRAGVIPQSARQTEWTEDEDRKLTAGYAHFTVAMLAGDMGRTPEAVRSRLRKLKQVGWRIDAMPRGHNRLKAAEQARVEYQDPELSSQAEREAVRDEVLAHIRFQVERQRLSAERAAQMLERITQSVLQAPEHQFKRYSAKSVAQIVMEAA